MSRVDGAENGLTRVRCNKAIVFLCCITGDVINEVMCCYQDNGAN